jgi:hypothetical protein
MGAMGVMRERLQRGKPKRTERERGRQTLTGGTDARPKAAAIFALTSAIDVAMPSASTIGSAISRTPQSCCRADVQWAGTATLKLGCCETRSPHRAHIHRQSVSPQTVGVLREDPESAKRTLVKGRLQKVSYNVSCSMRTNRSMA